MKSQKLDELLRTALQTLRPSVEENDWERLNASLNGAPADEGKRRPVGWFFMAGVLAGGLLIGLLWSNNALVNRKNPEAQNNRTRLTNTNPNPEDLGSASQSNQKERGGSASSVLPFQETNAEKISGSDVVALAKKGNTDLSVSSVPVQSNLSRPANTIAAGKSNSPQNKTTAGNSLNPQPKEINTSEVPLTQTENTTTPTQPVSEDLMAKNTSEKEAHELLTPAEEAPVTSPDDSLLKGPKPPSAMSAFERGWFVGMAVTPQVNQNNMVLKTAEMAGLAHKDYGDVRKNEAAMNSVSANLIVSYRFNPALSFQTGISYIQTGFKGAYDYYNTAKPIRDPVTGRITSYDIVDDPFGTQANVSQKFTYVGVPFQLSYSVGLSPKFRIGVRGGGSLQFLQQANAQMIDPYTLVLTKVSKGDAMFRKTMVSYQLAAGAYYAVTPKMILLAEPVYTSSLSPLLNDKAFTRDKLSSYGLNLGFMYRVF